MLNIKKSEHHIHIGGSWPLNFLKEIATPQQFSDLFTMINKIEGRVDYHDAFHAFTLINRIVDSDQKVERGVEALCQELARDNVVYVELRTGLKDLGSALRGYLEAVLRGVQKGTTERPLQVKLILSLRRDTNATVANQTIDLAIEYRDQGIVGLDLSGDSTIGDGKGILSALLRAKDLGFPLTLHIGESNKETPEQQMFELMTLQPKRVGHCVHLCEQAVEWIKSHRIPVELCLTSAVKAGMISEASQHPALQLLIEGHPVSICTDDPLIFNTTLSKEYALVAFHTGLNPEEIERTQREVAQYSF